MTFYPRIPDLRKAENTMSNFHSREICEDVVEELKSATSKNHPFNSLHEGYAVTLEELDEVWDIVKQKPSKRDYKHLRKELIQVAAMAIRTIIDTVDPELDASTN